MKQIQLRPVVLVVGCLLLLQAGCQKPKQSSASHKAPTSVADSAKSATTTKADKPAAKITFEQPIHDFGQVGPRTKNSCEFKFTNTGDALLKITRVVPSCSACTVAELSKTEFAPGQSGSINVTYRSSGKLGFTSYSVFVHSNDKRKPRFKLTLKAKIVSKVVHEPKKIQLSPNKENAGCPEITLRSLDNQPFAIKQFKSTANAITADYDTSVKATSFVLKPRVDIEKVKDGLKGRIEISLTHPQANLVTIVFNTLSEFTTNPMSIVIVDAEPKKPITRQVWILNNYDKNFDVDSTSSKKGFIKVLSYNKIDNRYSFDLEITPPPRERDKWFFMDVFTVNIKGGKKVEISCRGFYIKK